MTTPKLARTVAVTDARGVSKTFLANTRPPAWVIAKVSNPKAWEGGVRPDIPKPATKKPKTKTKTKTKTKAKGKGKKT